LTPSLAAVSYRFFQLPTAPKSKNKLANFSEELANLLHKTPTSLPDLCISVRKIGKSLKEIGKSLKEIYISSGETSWRKARLAVVFSFF